MGDLDAYNAGVLGIIILPNCMLEASSDYAMTLRFTPSSAEVTSVKMDWYVRENSVEGKDYDIERLTQVWKATAEQDWKLCENNQLGVESDHYEPGPYSPYEDGVDAFIRWYLQRLRQAD